MNASLKYINPPSRILYDEIVNPGKYNLALAELLDGPESDVERLVRRQQKLNPVLPWGFCLWPLQEKGSDKG